MSEVKVNKISPRTNCGTVQLGDSGDTITIPAGATITNNGTQTGFGRTGTVDWETTKKTASFTAVSGEGYFIDTSGGAVTMTLPASPSAGDIVGVKDYDGSFATNNVTVNRNSSNIDGSAANATLSEDNLSVLFVYVDSTQGWKATNSDAGFYGSLYVTATGGTVTTVGDFKVHRFNSPGTFCVSCAGNAAGSNSVCVMVVAGGGGGGNDDGGGGGAGGMVLTTSYPISASPFPISIGGGGNGGIPGCTTSGSNSSGLSLTGVGGGRGGAGSNSPNPWGVSPGGSGGGGQTNAGAAGSSTQSSQPGVSGSDGFGNAGGTGGTNPSSGQGGGGGGSGEAGNTDGQGYGGNGKNVSPVFGTAPQPFYNSNSPSVGPSACGQFAGGGAGAGACTQAKAGRGGGGIGAPPPSGSAGGNGLTNSGGGGGGGSCGSGPGGNGGSGVILIRYKFQN
jgi:hypothetical protein